MVCCQSTRDRRSDSYFDCNFLISFISLKISSTFGVKLHSMFSVRHTNIFGEGSAGFSSNEFIS